MSKESTLRAAKLAGLLARHYADVPIDQIAELVIQMQRASRATSLWELRSTNEPMTETERTSGDTRLRRTEARINRELSSYGRAAADNAYICLGGDVRGPCGRLHIPGQHGDGFAAGYAIY